MPIDPNHDEDCGLRHGMSFCTCGYDQASDMEKLRREVEQLNESVKLVIKCLKAILVQKHLHIPKEDE